MDAGTRTTNMEERLAEIGAGIDRLLDKTEHSDFIRSLRQELQVWREWLDEARVQASLGSMEARDRLTGASKTLEHLHSRIDQRIGNLDESIEPFPGLRDAVQLELEKGRSDLLSGAK